MRSRFLLAAIAALVNGNSCKAQQLVSSSSAGYTKPTAMERTSSYTFASRALGETRPVFIGLPASYQKSTRKYPVLFVLDGEAQFPIAVTVASQLASIGHIPEMIVVGIPNLDELEGRVHDMTPPGLSVSGSTKNEGGEQFLDFIEKELMPALQSQFRANGMMVLEGHSSGAIIASYAAATRPAFRFIISLDMPAYLGDNWMPKRMMERETRSNPGELRYVSLEALYGWDDSTWGQFAKAAPKSWKIDRRKLDHESHVSLPFVGLYLGLRTLFEDYQIKAAPQSPTNRTLAYYRDMEKSWGAPAIPSSGIIRQVLEDLEMEGQSKPAADAYRLLVENYGAPPDSLEWQKRLATLAAMPPLTETVESLLATPAPKTSDAQRFIGKWRGVEWMNDNVDDPHPIMLEFRDSAGVLAGEWHSYPETGVDLVQKLTYLKVTAAGLDFGFMNGMRPRGMLLHEGKLNGNTLNGLMRFGGIRNIRPPGMPGPPTIHFELKRESKSL